ncbi:MAG: T9SS type A sorting domain-containing protein [Bacteroidia bacterium]|nr:T9SS type A sorting domain-containing protein [Bacteroidia bacterium]
MKRLSLILLFISSLILPTQAQKIAKEKPVFSQDQTPSTYQKISLPFTQLPTPGQLSEALRKRVPLLDQTQSELRLTHQIESPGGYHFQFEQTYQGIPLLHQGLKANLNKSFRVFSLMNNLADFPPNVHGSFVITSEMIKGRIQRELPDGLFEVKVNQFYLPTDQGLQAVLVAETFGNDNAGGAWEIVFDAETGDEISRRDLASYAPPAVIDTSCKARVFMPDPITQAQTTYGGNYEDNEDADSPYLNAWRQEVTLRDIQWDGTNFILEGPYVVIKDIDAPHTQPFSPTDCASFNVLRFNDAFEDINAYYHIDTLHRYILDLGFTNLLTQAIRVDPHGLNGSDNSKFVPGSNAYLSFGEGGVDDAEDADVVLHEYGHALSYGGSPGTNIGTERQGLDEGIGDYIASSYSRGLSSYRWDWVFSWDGHNEFWPGRTSSDPTLYTAANKSDIYDVGEVWSSALMHAWGLLGKEKMDGIFFQELFLNFGQMNLHDAGLALLDADTMRNGGANTVTLVACLCQWDILQGVECAVGINPEIPENSWMVFPNPADQSIEIRFDQIQVGKVDHLEIFNLMGQQLKSVTVKGLNNHIDLADLENGLYLIRATGPNGVAGTKKIVVER